MDVLKCDIRIGGYSFDFCHEFIVDSTWEEMTVKSTITLPSKLKFDRNNLKSSIKKGDQITIQAGYVGYMNLIFSGFVARIKPSVPVIIEGEDLMWKLKQLQVNDVAKNTTLKSFLERNIPGVEIDCFDVEIPKFVANKITAAKLLDALKSDYGFYSFIRKGKLVVGKQYDASDYKTHIIQLDYNVAQDDLEFTEKDDVKLKVTGISNMSDGTKYEVEIGDPDGDSKTLNFYNIPEKDLKTLVEKESERLMYDGYRGTLTILGMPFIEPGDVIELRNVEESDKTGRYWVDGVKYIFGLQGIRQVIKIGART